MLSTRRSYILKQTSTCLYHYSVWSEYFYEAVTTTVSIVERGFPLVPVVSSRMDLRYFLDFTLLVRNKTAFVNEFKWTMINVIPNMNCRFSFSSSVNVASILPHYGTNHTRWQEYRYRDENLCCKSPDFLVKRNCRHCQYCFPWKHYFYLKNHHQNG